jgi:hypothetical protein
VTYRSDHDAALDRIAALEHALACSQALEVTYLVERVDRELRGYRRWQGWASAFGATIFAIIAVEAAFLHDGVVIALTSLFGIVSLLAAVQSVGRVASTHMSRRYSQRGAFTCGVTHDTSSSSSSRNRKLP